MRWGLLLTPWRALRHSLFVCGLSLAIASTAIIIGTVVHQDDEPTFPHASASGSTPASQARGESTSLGALTRFVKQSGSKDASSPAADATEAAVEEPGDGGSAEAAPANDEGSAEAVSESRVASALTTTVPLLAERPAEQADQLVTAARFKVKPTPTISEATSRTQTTAASLPDLRPGDQLTVPVTFYYCEDSTGGQRQGDGGGFCGVMRDGTTVYPGAAACEYSYLGQRFWIEGDPTGRTYVCADTGSGIRGQHRDIWFMSSGEGWAWQQVVGRSAVIHVIP